MHLHKGKVNEVKSLILSLNGIFELAEIFNLIFIQFLIFIITIYYYNT